MCEFSRVFKPNYGDYFMIREVFVLVITLLKA